MTSGKPIPLLGYLKAVLRGRENKLSSAPRPPGEGDLVPCWCPGGSVEERGKEPWQDQLDSAELKVSSVL